ncbi:MAG: phospho-N-acetylmuramoyl-pentapeptide-transferase [Myxococcales bacterium]|nr:phospho-N-acetylmuramoyl-pentapeptide-transferase [Myxococcales bacterium]
MFFWIYQMLQDDWSPLRVFKYVPFRTIGSTLTALVITMWLYPWFIRRLRGEKVGETIRDDGPDQHKKKSGTPTMGGSLMLIALILSSLLWANLMNSFVWLILAITFTLGVIGFVDDYQKLRKKKGITGKTKLALQFVVVGACLGVYSYIHPFNTKLTIPFLRVDLYGIDLPLWLYLPFAVTYIVGTSNAVNLTDGLDGLAIGPVIIAAGTLLILCYLGGATFMKKSLAEYLRIPAIPQVYELPVVAGAMAGAGIGFLWYNTYPASVFMGDVGSLALGGALGTLAVLSKNELLGVIILGIFVVEAISVITQTVSYKLTGKRVFRMAPIHHHFELKGWAEPKIIVRFWIIAIFLALIAMSSLKLR